MRRFRFPLAKVHRWRAQQERAARRDLGAAVTVLAALDQELLRLQQNVAVCQGEQQGSAAGLARAVEAGMVAQRALIERRRNAAQVAVERAREVYQLRRRDRRAIDRLLDTRREQWRAECQAAEQAEVEEGARALAWQRKAEEAQG